MFVYKGIKITPRNLLYKIRSWILLAFIYKDFLKFKKMDGNSRFSLSLLDAQPCLKDNTSTTSVERHYFYHPAWAARILANLKPDYHVDISSATSFSQIVSAFIPVRFYDYRPLEVTIDNLTCGKADLVNLPFKDGEIKSLSCMHTIEHVGLGRYGDKMDPDGDLKAMKELKRVLAPGGSLLFVVPLGGKARIQFNAHRIYTYDQIMDYFSDLTLKEFALIPDLHTEGDLVRNATRELANSQRHGCGCFWFVKNN